MAQRSSGAVEQRRSGVAAQWEWRRHRDRRAPSAQYEQRVPGELRPEEWQYGQREEWRTPEGKGAEC
jgi:hypothetical protein